MSPLRYFAYGSNLDADQMRERCPESRALFTARLPDFRLDFTHFSTRWSGGAADIVAAPDAVVWGVVYELPAHDLDRLDAFEAGYERVPLRVHCARDDAHDVVSYAVRAKQLHAPSDVYVDKMLRWGAHWGFPPEYLAALRRRG